MSRSLFTRRVGSRSQGLLRRFSKFNVAINCYVGFLKSYAFTCAYRDIHCLAIRNLGDDVSKNNLIFSAPIFIFPRQFRHFNHVTLDTHSV